MLIFWNACSNADCDLCAIICLNEMEKSNFFLQRMWYAWHCLSILAFNWGWICGMFCCRFQWAELWMLALLYPLLSNSVCVAWHLSLLPPSRPPPLFSAAQWDHVVLLIFQQRPLSLLPLSRFLLLSSSPFYRTGFASSFSSAVVTCFYALVSCKHWCTVNLNNVVIFTYIFTISSHH